MEFFDFLGRESRKLKRKYSRQSYPSEKRDIFAHKPDCKRSKRHESRQNPRSEMYIRMVLPAEQTIAIAKSMLERQLEPERTLIDLELQRMEADKKKSKRHTSARKADCAGRGNAKSRTKAVSTDQNQNST